ncbi:PrgI family protein [Patescibacteria group bacterium]|nr:PrgI family protein [Patescibacteria group bacterium]
MEFQVPQFIDQKPKIVGFLTLQQFFYVGGAALLGYISFQIFNLFFAVVATVILGLIGVAFAFVKINGQDFPSIVASAFSYFWQPRTYTWQRVNPTTTIELDKFNKIDSLRHKMGLEERLKNVALSVTTGRIFAPKTPAGGETRGYETVVYLTGERKQAKRVDY